MPLPYAHLKLRRNPFGEPPQEDLTELLVTPHLDEANMLLRTSQTERVTIQLLGECGRGKSTSMRFLQAQHPETLWLYFSDLEPHPPIPWRAASRPETILFVDESQRLSWSARQRLFMSPCQLVLGTHRDHTGELMATWRGRSMHTIKVGGRLTPTQLREILEKRIMWAMLDRSSSPAIELDEALIEELLARHNDDLRAILDTAYELVQVMKGPGRIPLPSECDLPYIPESRHLKRGETRHIHHSMEKP